MSHNKESKTNNSLPITSFVLESKILGEMLYRKEQNQTIFATYLDGLIEESLSFKVDGFTYKPYSPSNPLLLHKVIRFPTTTENYVSFDDLLEEVQKFFRRYFEIPKVMEHIATHYIFLTWVYDAFNELPYLRVRGDFGTGKTRFLNVVSALCYKPIMASGASTVAPLFHILNLIGGTLVLDEADFRFSSETADITKILNNGHAKGFPVLRCQQKQNKEFKPKAFNVFGPKIIASRGSYEDDALESRCITFDMHFRRKRNDLPLTLPKDFEEQATSLRNKLLAWRFHTFFKSCDLEGHNSKELSPRLNQIYAPLLALITDTEVYKDVVAFAKRAGEQARVDRGHKVEADVLTIVKSRREKKLTLSIGEITADFKKRYTNKYERKITSSWIGGVVRLKLHLTTKKTHGRYVISEGQGDLLLRQYESFNVE